MDMASQCGRWVDRRDRGAARQRDVRAASGARGFGRLERSRADGGSRALDAHVRLRPPRDAGARGRGGGGGGRGPRCALAPAAALGRGQPATVARARSRPPGRIRAVEPQGGLPGLHRRVPHPAAVRGRHRRLAGHGRRCRGRRTGRCRSRSSSAMGSACSCWRWLASGRSGSAGSALLGRATRGALFLSHWLVVVPVALLRIALGSGPCGLRADAAGSPPFRAVSPSRRRARHPRIGRRGGESRRAGGRGGDRNRGWPGGGRWQPRRNPIAPGARIVDAGDAAVIPGIHDFHIHLVGLARARRQVLLDDAVDPGDMAARLSDAATGTPPDGWIGGRGWKDAQLGAGVAPLEAAVGDRAAFLMSHDGHSAWASAAARRRAGLDRDAPDPAGGRIERDERGDPTGVPARASARPRRAARHRACRARRWRTRSPTRFASLPSLGITGASEAGDYTDENGVGTDAPLATRTPR